MGAHEPHGFGGAPSDRVRVVLGVIGILFVLAVGGKLIWRHFAPRPAPADDPPTALASTSDPPPATSPALLPTAPQPIAPPVVGSFVVPPPSAAAATTKPRRAAPRPACNPPYIIDAAGDRQYKPECM